MSVERVSTATAICLLCLGAPGACLPESGDELIIAGEPAQQPRAIIGGARETGWPAVGALYLRHRYDGSQTTFCSGSLVAPRWVLTAAHCIHDEGYEHLPAMVTFFIGDDALPAEGSLDPAQGPLLATTALYPHPDFAPGSFDHDVGLVYLAAEVADVEPLGINQETLSWLDIGESSTYVGFGVDDGVARTGSGIKRSIDASISWVAPQHYRVSYPEAGTCYGDSGGPGLRVTDSGASIIGITSAHVSDVPCEDGYAKKTRVAIHADWIAATMATTPDCLVDDMLCLCQEACQEGGACDDGRCATLTCGEAIACEEACADDECTVRCALSVVPAQRAVWEAYVACRQAACDRDLWDHQLHECAASACGDLLQACEAGSSEGDGGAAADAQDRPDSGSHDALPPADGATDDGATDGGATDNSATDAGTMNDSAMDAGAMDDGVMDDGAVVSPQQIDDEDDAADDGPVGCTSYRRSAASVWVLAAMLLTAAGRRRRRA